MTGSRVGDEHSYTLLTAIYQQPDLNFQSVVYEMYQNGSAFRYQNGLAFEIPKQSAARQGSSTLWGAVYALQIDPAYDMNVDDDLLSPSP